MAYLSSSSTLAQVQAAYQDNASYDVQGSTSMAGYFIDACRHLLQRLPSEVQNADASRIRQDAARLQTELKEAKEWLESRTSSSGAVGLKIRRTTVKYVDTSE